MHDRNGESARLTDLARRILAGEPVDWDAAMRQDPAVVAGLRRLQALVAPGDESTGTAAAPPPDPPTPPPSPPPKKHRDDRFIGDFRLVRTLGEGGMGVVYEAEQQHPRRPVALKVIRGGQNVGPDTLKLFQREAQTLARLRHPGIAALYETGVTDDGLHFFAMELVRGETLLDWLKKRPDVPSPEELKLRLAVFKKICDAVAYAHQRGVIHRDLKPGNVLIPKASAAASFQDPVPDVKVLDFGLARITDSDVQATTYVTEMGKVQGTLPYMSPEQVRGNPDEIDQRTDVYSLGVILYQMVTGRLPYDLSKAQLPDAVRIICEEPPRSISATFSGSKRVDADVVTIAGKALEKEPARRYQSVAALAEDVARYLSDQPILARPPSATYQLRKLVTRHKGPFAFAATVFVLVTALAVTSTLQAVRISKERDRANQEAETAKQISEFMEGLFKVADPSEARGNTITAREILDQGAEKVQRELTNQPETQARLMHTMANVYLSLGLRDRAEPLLEEALSNLGTPDENALERAALLNALGVIAMDRGDNNASLQLHEQAHTLRSGMKNVPPELMARSLWFLGCAQNWAGREKGGEATLLRALRILEQAPGEPDRRLMVRILNDLANQRFPQEQYDDATKYLRRAYDLAARSLPQDDPERILMANGLGWALLLAGRLEEARPWLERAVQDGERIYGKESPLLTSMLHSLGELDRRSGRSQEADALLRRALQIRERHGTDRDLASTEILVSLGRTRTALHDFSEAERLVRSAVAIIEQAEGPETPLLREPLLGLSEVLEARGQTEQAAQVAKRARSIPGGAGYYPVNVNAGALEPAKSAGEATP